MKVHTNTRMIRLKRKRNDSTAFTEVNWLRGGRSLVNTADLRRYAYRYWASHPEYPLHDGSAIMKLRPDAFVIINRGIVMHAYSWWGDNDEST